jgi:hypothetical protein
MGPSPDKKFPLNWACCKFHNNSLTPFIASPPLLADDTNRIAATATMANSWQSPEQKAFIEEHIPSYVQHIANGTAKTKFWPDFLVEWFKAWPLSEPTPELVEEKGNVQKALKSMRSKKISVSAIYLRTSRLELTVRTATEACLQVRCRQQSNRRPTESSPRRCSTKTVGNPNIYESLLRLTDSICRYRAMGQGESPKHGL